MPEPIVSFDNEPRLKIDSYFIAPDIAQEANDRFFETHRINSGEENNEIPRPNQSKIYMSALKELYETVSERRDVKPTVNGIEIHYGISTDGHLTYYYQTWYLTNLIEQTNSVNGKVERDDTFYQYDPRIPKFVIAEKDKLEDIERYARWIRIQSIITIQPVPHEPEWQKMAPDDDPTSILFSFQELFLVYHRNNEDCWIEKEGPADTCTYDGYIEQLPSTKSDASRNEHSIMFKYGTNAIVWPEKGTIGNIAHICPPNCTDIEYP